MRDVMGYAQRPGKIVIARSSIGVGHRLLVDQRQKRFPDMFAMELGLLELGGVSLSVARHHRWDLFFSYVPSFDDFSPLAWCSL